MNESLIFRNVHNFAEEILSDTPVLTISGARQVGKSTLVKQLLEGRNHRFINLDNDGALTSALADPDGFVRQFPEGMLAIDEVQRAPGLLRAIKGALEEDRRPGRFLLTGSSNLLSLKGAEESLAGRAETIRLHGFSQGEKLGRVEDFPKFVWGLDTLPDVSPMSRSEYFELMCTPSFPEITDATARRANRWFAAYIERIISKDVSEIFGIKYPDRLFTLLEQLSAQGMSEFVSTHVGRRLDIPERSVPAYLKALSDVFVVNSLPAWGTNLEKRAVSKPKVFLSDTAMAASLAGIDAHALELDISSVITGGLCEAFVANELLKQQSWSEVDFRLYHYRNSAGKEVDLVLESRARKIVGIEVKAAMSIQSKDFAGLRHLQQVAGSNFQAGVLLYSGKEILPMGPNLWAMPIATLWSV